MRWAPLLDSGKQVEPLPWRFESSRRLFDGFTTRICYHAVRVRDSLRTLQREQTCVALAPRRRSRKAIAVPRDESVHERAQPPKRRNAGDLAKPHESRQYAEYGQASFEPPQPFSLGSAHVHFPVEIAARKGRLCGHLSIVVIQESQPRMGIVRFHLRPCPLAERAGAVH